MQVFYIAAIALYVFVFYWTDARAILEHELQATALDNAPGVHTP